MHCLCHFPSSAFKCVLPVFQAYFKSSFSEMPFVMGPLFPTSFTITQSCHFSSTSCSSFQGCVLPSADHNSLRARKIPVCLLSTWHQAINLGDVGHLVPSSTYTTATPYPPFPSPSGQSLVLYSPLGVQQQKMAKSRVNSPRSQRVSTS